MGANRSGRSNISAVTLDSSSASPHDFATAAVERLVALHHRPNADSPTGAVDSAQLTFESTRERLHESLSVSSPFSALVRSAALTADEAEVLAVLIGCETDERLQKLLVHVHGEAHRARVELGTLMALFETPHPRALAVADSAGLRRAGLITVRMQGPWSRHTVELAPTVISALLGDPTMETAVPYSARVLDEPERSGSADAVLVVGPDAVRRRQAALAVLGGGRLLVCPAPTEPAEWEAIIREATLLNAAVVLELDGVLSPVGQRWIDQAHHLRFVLSARRPLASTEMPRRRFVEMESDGAEPTDDEWRAALGSTPRTHRLTAEQLEMASGRFEANGRDLDLTVRRLVSARLDDLTRRVRPERGWHELVLPDEQVSLLSDMVHRYRNGGLVFDDWGFPTSPSRGLVLLFSGPSGTGKTLAAEVMAGALGLDLYRLDLSSVVSKFIGETEKNLDEVFAAAGAGNLVLFFDEADALFGKRSEVKDAHDRYANLEVSYLLQRLERYDGVVVLATNFEKNIDDAFMRRIHARIDFTVPSSVQRREIWVQHLPDSAPLEDNIDLTGIAERFELSGGSIRNAAVTAAFIAADRGDAIGTTHILLAIQRELRKQGRLIKTSEFPELDS
ncbi:MAG TPA: ATP-binding protein [Ilumatobacteraceae bacterium]|nr:ATP-binding protein [Ilumatobacteraceae bacterium]